MSVEMTPMQTSVFHHNHARSPSPFHQRHQHLRMGEFALSALLCETPKITTR